MVTTRSGKNKGQRLQKETVVQLRGEYNLDATETSCFEGDIQAKIMGASGIDVMLSPHAKTLIPYDIECKNTEKLNIWGALKQCEGNAKEGRIPLVVFRRNNTQAYACLKMEDFIKMRAKK